MVFLSTLSLCHSTPRFFSIFVSFILFFHLVSGLCNGKDSRIRNFHFHPVLDLGQVTSIHLHLHFLTLNWDNAAYAAGLLQ